MEAIIYNRVCWIYHFDTSPLQTELQNFLKAAQFGILGQLEHHFSPFGYTKIWMLAESHLALHTFPEHNAIYLELSSCVQEKAEVFWSCLLSWADEYQVQLQLSHPRTEKLIS